MRRARRPEKQRLAVQEVVEQRATAVWSGRRLFIPCGRARASAAVRLGQAMPGAPLDTAAPSRAPRVAPFRKLRVADAWFTRSAKACATRSFRFAAAPSVVRSSSDGTQDASKTFEVRKPGRLFAFALLHEFGEGRRELRSEACRLSWRTLSSSADRAPAAALPGSVVRSADA